MARKSKLTPELIERIASLIATGNYTKVVCGLVGIGESTFYRWMERGEQATRGIHREFWERVKKAEAAREAKWVKDIDSDPSWQSKAWLLERRYPERWGKREQVAMEHSGEVTQRHEQHIRVTDELLGDNEFLRALQEAAQRASEIPAARRHARGVDPGDDGGDAVGEAD